MNIPLLLQIADRISKHPEKFRMESWVSDNGMGTDHGIDIAECGTACCIAGWACALSGNAELLAEPIIVDEGLRILRAAEEALQIDYGVSHKLVSAEWWPSPFNGEYKEAKTQEAKAEVAVRRIHHLIATGQ